MKNKALSNAFFFIFSQWDAAKPWKFYSSKQQNFAFCLELPVCLSEKFRNSAFKHMTSCETWPAPPACLSEDTPSPNLAPDPAVRMQGSSKMFPILWRERESSCRQNASRHRDRDTRETSDSLRSLELPLFVCFLLPAAKFPSKGFSSGNVD